MATPHLKNMYCLRVVQSENVVEHVVGAGVRDQVEHLGVSLGVLLLVNQQLTGDHDQNVAVWRGRLGIQGGDSVGNLGEWQGGEFLDNVLCSLQLGGLKGQHGLVPVQGGQLGPVGVELLVVEVAELGGNGVEVCG